MRHSFATVHHVSRLLPKGSQRLSSSHDKEPLMANTPTAVGTIKILPDMSEFAARLTQEISLDDPLARAIIDETHANPEGFRAAAVIGERAFHLHHWTILAATDTEPQRLRTSWIEYTSEAPQYLPKQVG